MRYSRFSNSEVELHLKNEEDLSQIATICDALSSETRLKILKVIQTEPFIHTLPELVALTGVPTSTLLHHLQKLEKANIIYMSYRTSTHGTVRIIGRDLKAAHLTFYYNDYKKSKVTATAIQSLGVGMYTSFEAYGSFVCLVGSDMMTDKADIYNPKHYNAQLIATTNGRVTYEFSNSIATRKTVTELLLSFEICSEAPYHDNNFMSDVTFWINGREITTYLSDGDYGDRVGRLNPDWWPKVNTQYGKLVNLIIKPDGVYINDVKYESKYNLNNIGLLESNKISVTIGNKNTAEHIGGFNLFGSTFGDHPQDICLQFTYED